MQLCRQREQSFRMQLLDLTRRCSAGTVAQDKGTNAAWLATRLGDGITLHEAGTVIEHRGSDGCTTQLLDGWFESGVTTLDLLVEEVPPTANFFVGVVGRNFVASDSNVPLAASKHAVAMDATGQVTKKGAGSALVMPLPRDAATRRSSRDASAPRPPVVHSGARVRVTFDMSRRDMCLELLSGGSGEDATVESAISVDGLPDRVALAVCFGPGEHRIRLLRTGWEEAPPPEVTYPAVRPLRNYRGRSQMLSKKLRAHLEEVAVARMME